jgi:hypothetical protein
MERGHLVRSQNCDQYKDDQQKAEESAGHIAPTMAVGPRRQAAQNQNQQKDQHNHSHKEFLATLAFGIAKKKPTWLEP